MSLRDTLQQAWDHLEADRLDEALACVQAATELSQDQLRTEVEVLSEAGAHEVKALHQRLLQVAVARRDELKSALEKSERVAVAAKAYTRGSQLRPLS